MAALNTLYNLVACGAAAVLGTGTVGCAPFFEKVSAIWLLPSGYKFDGTATFNLAYVQQEQAKGNIIILKGVENFTDNTPDDVIEEFESGRKKYVRDGLYEFLAQFSKGMYFNAALNYLNSDGSYDMIFVDVNGNILGTKATDGNLKGFTCGMVHQTKITWATDSTAQREGLMFQFTVRNEFDRDYVYIQASGLDFAPETLDGANEIVLELTTPTNTSTTATVKATRKQDGAAFTGAAYTDFLFQADGVTQNPTAGDDSAVAGTYQLTGFTAWSTGEVVTVQLYDNSNSRSIINLSTVLYKSNIETETVVV